MALVLSRKVGETINCIDLASDSLDEAKASAVHVIKQTIAQLNSEIGSVV